MWQVVDGTLLPAGVSGGGTTAFSLEAEQSLGRPKTVLLLALLALILVVDRDGI